MTAARHARHERLSAFLASCSDIELAALVDTARPISVGVGGGSVVLDVDGVPVFAKRIPLTDRELANPGSTANLFDLPVHCQYGIGSPGFNAWRELTANMIVTGAILAGQTQSFPVLYHWRVLPAARRSQPNTPTSTRLSPPSATAQPCVPASKHSPPHPAASCCSANTSRTRYWTGCARTRQVRPPQLSGSCRRS